MKSLPQWLQSLIWWFLYTSVGQWLSCCFTGGWCYIDKNDKRYAATPEDYMISYDGDETALPDKGISRQRDSWSTWICVQLHLAYMQGGYLAIDTYDGRRMACLGWYIRPNEAVLFRVGHEPGKALFLTRIYRFARIPGIEFVYRFRKSDPVGEQISDAQRDLLINAKEL